jgi:hypothetical protein
MNIKLLTYLFKIILIVCLISACTNSNQAKRENTELSTTQVNIAVYLLLDKNFIGDCNQAKGIGNALIEICKYNNINCSIKELDITKNKTPRINTITEHNDKKHIVIIIVGIGQSGINVFSKERFNNAYTIWAGHQAFDGLMRLANKVDMIALPMHVITPEIDQVLRKSNTLLVKTSGVAHNLTVESLQQAKNNWNGAPLKKNARHLIGVFLGGDAPTSKGVMRYFTCEEAALLGNYIARLAKKTGAFVIVTNGPRTGKYDPILKVKRPIHKENCTTDPTSAVFITQLQKENVPYQFFDFQYGKSSAYQAILAVLIESGDTKIFVTGDSTSMISEICDLTAKQMVYVVDVGSMNDTHKAHAISLCNTGKISRMMLDGDAITIVKQPAKNETYLPAAQAIAKHVINQINLG